METFFSCLSLHWDNSSLCRIDIKLSSMPSEQTTASLSDEDKFQGCWSDQHFSMTTVRQLNSRAQSHCHLLFTRAHMASQRLKWQAQGPHGSVSGPLRICDGHLAWCFHEAPSNGNRYISDSYLLLRLFSFYWVASIWGLLPCHIVFSFTLFGCPLLEAIFFFSEEEMGWEAWVWRRGEVEGRAKTSGEREKYSQDVLYEKRIYYW